MNQTLLQKLNMTSKEVQVYLKLLELGSSGANSLSKRLNENRTSTYSLLWSMQKKGFVSYIKKGNVKYFMPADPSILIKNYIEEAHGLQKFLPELLVLYNKFGSPKPKITFYEGVSGIKQIGEILLEVPGSTRYSFMGADEKTIHPEIKRYYEEDFVNRRIKLGITYQAIVTGFLPMGSEFEKTEKGQLRKLKFVDPEKFPVKIHIDIFPKNKVALYSYHKDEMMGVMIEHEAFYKTMVTVFKLAWAGVDKFLI